MYKFNNAGWFDGVEHGAKRSTDIAVPQGGWGDKALGLPYPRFTGREWRLLPYDGFDGVDMSQPAEDEAQPSPVPEVVITDIAADATYRAVTTISDDLRTVDTMAGATLTFTTELHVNGERAPVSTVFRMPLKSVGSPTNDRLIKVEFVDGRSVFTVKLPESRHWRVTKETINQSLEAGEQLDFAGLDVYVME